MPAFQIVTTAGATYTDGDKREFAFLDSTETLLDLDTSGNWIVLKYSGGVTVGIPETQIAHVIDTRPDA